MRRWVVVVALALLAAVGCSKQNAAFCCATEADCAANGVTDGLRPCDEGLACIANSCEVASCATDGCEAAAPVCDLTSDTCAGCSENTDCARFGGSPLCDGASGGCVQCVTSSNCGGTTPVCDDNACRSCQLDSECPSWACGENGACVGEESIVYLSPQGSDVGECSATQPCKELRFGVEKTTPTRNRIVFATGTYVLSRDPLISSQQTSAASLTIHGAGSTLDISNADLLLRLRIPTRLKDVTIINPLGTAAVYVESEVAIESSELRGAIGVRTSGTTTLRDVRIEATDVGVSASGGSLTVDRAVIEGGNHAIQTSASGSVNVNITNLLAYGTSNVGLDLADASGSVSFTTVANTGGMSTTASGIDCDFVEIRSSVIWNPGVARPAIVGNCTRVTTIAGPAATADTENVDPMFVSPAAENFRLGANSPARDKVDTGPTTDFEGDPRPRGARFDVGADEAP